MGQDPSPVSESRIRVQDPSPVSESSIRVQYPSPGSESQDPSPVSDCPWARIRVQDPSQACDPSQHLSTRTPRVSRFVAPDPHGLGTGFCTRSGRLRIRAARAEPSARTVRMLARVALGCNSRALATRTSDPGGLDPGPARPGAETGPVRISPPAGAPAPAVGRPFWPTRPEIARPAIPGPLSTRPAMPGPR